MNEIQAIIRNRREELRRVQHAVDQLAARCHLPAEIVGDMQVALDEILSNIIKYGYADDAEHQIEVRLRVVDNAFEATIEDDGMPFNPLESRAPDVESGLQERRLGGVGVHYIKNLMSEIRYNREDNRNCVVLSRKFSA